jgi:hypothetical protein
MNTVLIEVYWSSAAPMEHKKTAHYQTWRDTVAGMIAEPGPAFAGWGRRFGSARAASGVDGQDGRPPLDRS